MRAGQLRHQITIQRPVETRDAVGAVVTEWQPSPPVWAEVGDISGREYFAAQAVNAETTTRIRIRHRAGIVPKMRVLHPLTGTVYDIQAVLDPTGRRQELHLMCRTLP